MARFEQKCSHTNENLDEWRTKLTTFYESGKSHLPVVFRARFRCATIFTCSSIKIYNVVTRSCRTESVSFSVCHCIEWVSVSKHCERLNSKRRCRICTVTSRQKMHELFERKWRRDTRSFHSSWCARVFVCRNAGTWPSFECSDGDAARGYARGSEVEIQIIIIYFR